jgi:hypothetical protein
MSDDLERIVYRVVRGHLAAEHPELLGELDMLFEPAFEMLSERLSGAADAAQEGSQAGRERSGLPIDGFLPDQSVVAFALWVAVQLADRALQMRRERARERRVREEREQWRDEVTQAVIEAVGAERRRDREVIQDLSRRAVEEVLGAGASTSRRASWSPVEPVPVPSVQLLVQYREEDGTPVFEFSLFGGAAGVMSMGRPVGVQRLDRGPSVYLQELAYRIAQLPLETEEDRRRARAWARRRGARLFEVFLPEALQKILRKLSGKVDELIVVSNDPWIPWELLKFPGDGREHAPFLSEAFALTRWIPGDAPTATFPLRRMAVVRSARARLERSKKERDDLLGRAESGRRRIDEIPAEYEPLTDEMAGGHRDGWHFIGHGDTSRYGAEWWQILLDDWELTPEDLSEEVAQLGSAHPLVFLNACHTGGNAPGLVGLGGWAARFLEVGAGAFLGPQWAVRDEVAVEFAREFYDRFLGGAPLGHAVRAARLALRRRFPGDPAWLAYTLYGHPLATCPRVSERASIDPPAQGSKRGKAWTDKREWKRLAHRLSTERGRAYEALVVRLLRGALGAWSEELISLADGLWAEGLEPPYPVVARILRWDAAGEELGMDELRECEEEISRFRNSGIEAEHFLLIHNRHSGSRLLREGAGAALRDLEASGTVRRAELWDYQRLLRRAFNGMLDLLVTRSRQRSLSLATVAEVLGNAAWREEPLERVPLETSTLVADQFRLRAERDHETLEDDPADLVLAGEERSITLVLGAFGFGKTTALARALVGSEREIFFVPAATISDEVHGAKDLFERCVALDRLLEGASVEDLEDYRLLARPIIEYVFKQKEIDAVLLLDGLDESPFLARPGGLQNLINNLWDLRVPVVLSMRTEYWDDKRQDFEASFGDLPNHDERRVRRLRKIELLPWGDRQIAELLDRIEGTVEAPAARARLEELASWLEDGRFERIYGDIPRRPLFLRLIAETALDRGLPGERVGRARLLAEAAEVKIRRDVAAPWRVGGEGRASILGRPMSVSETVELAWRAMVAAAACMVRNDGDGGDGGDGGVGKDGLEVLSECRLDAVREAVPELQKLDDPLGLFLHSLLRLTHPRTGRQAPQVRFAHRTFQEFFLAWHLVETGRWKSVRTPESVGAWIRDLKDEGLVGSEPAD